MARAAKNRIGSQLRPGSASAVEMPALVSLHQLPDEDMARLMELVENAGIHGVRSAKVVVSPDAAECIASNRQAIVKAVIIAGEGPEAPELAPALDAAKRRGDALKRSLLAAPDMLSTAEMAERLGMSEEGVRLKRKRHEVLGLELAKRGIRYPSWQVLNDRTLLPGLPRLFQILGDSPWTIYRFLLQHHAELGGVCGIDALRQGRVEDVLAASENSVAGGYA